MQVIAALAVRDRDRICRDFPVVGQVRVERLPFISPEVRVTRRYARLIAGMTRHMPISTRV